MAYFVELKERDAEHFTRQGLSERSLLAVERFVVLVIGAASEADFADPDRHPKPGGATLFTFALVDFWGDRQPHTFRFYVGGAGRACGVLKVLYADCV